MARGTLDRDKIGAAALELADEGGLGAVTARNLAARLGVTPTALYRHVPNLAAVTDGLLERVIVEARILDHASAALDEFLVETFSRVHTCLLAHPSVLPLLGTSGRFGTTAVGVADAVLGRLAAAGYSADAAVRVFDVLIGYTIGVSCLEAAIPKTSEVPPGVTLAPAPYVLAAVEPMLRFLSKGSFRERLAAVVEATLAANGETAARTRPKRRR